MELLEEEDPDRYQQQFAKYIEKELEGDGLKELYEEAHKKIREDPTYTKTNSGEKTSIVKEKKRTLEERKEAVQAKKDAMRAALEAADDDDDDDDDDEE